jgi:hypothetical protein
MRKEEKKPGSKEKNQIHSRNQNVKRETVEEE